MTIIKGYITSTGLAKSTEAASHEGWYIKPKKFALSSTKGELSKTRSLTDLEPTWYENWISGRDVQDPGTIVFLCMVPPEQASALTAINEIYLIAEDDEGIEFLLFVGQPDDTVSYDPNGTTRLRLQVTIANVEIGAVYQFIYTQAQEIESHNGDPNAHPDIVKKLAKIGYPLNMIDHNFGGQLIDELTTIDATVPDKKIVYLNTTTKKYELAIADGSVKARAVGVAVRTTDYSHVISGGFVQTNLNADPYNAVDYAIVYLSSTNPGEFTTGRTNIPIGVHIHSGIVYVFTAPGLIRYAGIGGSGGGTTILVNTDGITIEPNCNVFADVFNNPVTVPLPLNSRDGDFVKVFDTKGYSRVNNITVNRQGSLIGGDAEDFIIDIDRAVVTFTYSMEDNNWMVDFGGSRFTGYVE